MTDNWLKGDCDEVWTVLDAAPLPLIVSRVADGTVLYANAASKSLLLEWRSKVNGSVPDEWLRHVSNVLRLSVGREIEIEI